MGPALFFFLKWGLLKERGLGRLPFSPYPWAGSADPYSSIDDSQILNIKFMYIKWSNNSRESKRIVSQWAYHNFHNTLLLRYSLWYLYVHVVALKTLLVKTQWNKNLSLSLRSRKKQPHFAPAPPPHLRCPLLPRSRSPPRPLSLTSLFSLWPYLRHLGLISYVWHKCKSVLNIVFISAIRVAQSWLPTIST